MDIVKKADQKLEALYKSTPKLDESARKSLAKAWPWIALVFGVLRIIAAYSLWHVVHVSKAITDYLGTIYASHVQISAVDKFMVYLGMVSLLVEGILLLMAYPKLKEMKSAGWRMLFVAALLGVAYAVLSLFINQRGFSSFMFEILGSAVGFWLLYQVKPLYKD